MTGLAMNWENLKRIPMMQDSAYGIALPISQLLEYAKSLLGEDYPLKPNVLVDSGYRRLNVGEFSLVANVGTIGPSYQPGHAHADELNFELFFEGDPIIVDTGVVRMRRMIGDYWKDQHKAIIVLFQVVTQVMFGQDLELGKERMLRLIWTTIIS